MRPERGIERGGVFATRIWWGALALAVIAASVAAHYQLFTSFAPYDDEGYLLLSLRMVTHGKALYDEVYSQYGPAYYALHGAFHKLTSIPINHDVTRFKTMAVWIGTALLGAAYVYRMTRLRWLGLWAFLATCFHLDRLGLEPAHPHDVCLLAIAGVLLLSTYLKASPWSVPQQGGRLVESGTPRAAKARRGWGLLPPCGMGILSAIALMTKVNVGVFLTTGTLLGLVFVAKENRLLRVARPLLMGGAMMLPWLLARHHGMTLSGVQLPVVVTTAIGIVSWVAWQLSQRPVLGDMADSHHERLDRKSVAWYLGSTVIVAILFGIGALCHGTSVGGLAYGLIGQHLGFVDGFYEDPPIYLLASLSALVVAVFGVRAWRGDESSARWFRLAIVVLAVGMSLRHLADSFSEIAHGANDRGQAALLVSFFTPLAWIVLLPYSRGQGTTYAHLEGRQVARVLLCSIAVLQPLMVYPIPGSQVLVGSLPLLLVLFVGVGDCLHIDGLLGEGETPLRRLLVASLVGLSAMTVLCRDAHFWHRYSQRVPLHLVGAECLRLPAAYVARKQWTVARLKEHADTFLCMQNGHNSLYLWSDLDPPTGWNTTLWQDLLDDEQQRRVVRALQRQPRVCVVVDKNEPLPRRQDNLLADFIHRWFEPVYRNGPIEIWMPRIDCIQPTRETLARFQDGKG